MPPKILENMVLKPGKQLEVFEEVSTPYGDGYRQKLRIGDQDLECTQIRDKKTGAWGDPMGDPTACQVLLENAVKFNGGRSLTGASTPEKLREV